MLGKPNFHVLWEGPIFRAQVAWRFVERLCPEISRSLLPHPWDFTLIGKAPRGEGRLQDPPLAPSCFCFFIMPCCNARGWGAFGAHSNLSCATSKCFPSPWFIHLSIGFISHLYAVQSGHLTWMAARFATSASLIARQVTFIAVPGVSPGDDIQVILGCGALHLKIFANVSCVNAAVRSRGPRTVRFHCDFPFHLILTTQFLSQGSFKWWRVGTTDFSKSWSGGWHCKPLNSGWCLFMYFYVYSFI